MMEKEAEFLQELREKIEADWQHDYAEQNYEVAKRRKPYIRSHYPVDAVLDLDDRDLMMHMGVPQEFCGPRRHSMPLNVRNWLRSIQYIQRPTFERQDEKPDLIGAGMVFHGPGRTGKTTQAARLLLELVRLDIRSTDPALLNRAWHARSMGMFVDWQDASAKFRWAAGGSDTEGVVEKMRSHMIGEGSPKKRADFLVLDDISRERATAFNSGELHRILRHRSSNGLATIVTTNHAPSEWESVYGDVLAAYLANKFIQVEFAR